MVSMMEQKHQETMKFPLIFLNLVSGQRIAREIHDHLLWLPHVRLITAACRFWTVPSHGNAISHDTLLSPWHEEYSSLFTPSDALGQARALSQESHGQLPPRRLLVCFAPAPKRPRNVNAKSPRANPCRYGLGPLRGYAA